MGFKKNNYLHGASLTLTMPESHYVFALDYWDDSNDTVVAYKCVNMKTNRQLGRMVFDTRHCNIRRANAEEIIALYNNPLDNLQIYGV